MRVSVHLGIVAHTTHPDRSAAAAQRFNSAKRLLGSLNSANGAYTRQRLREKTATGAFLTKAPGLPNPADQFQYGFDTSWELDPFGRVRRSVEAADAATLARRQPLRSRALPSISSGYITSSLPRSI